METLRLRIIAGPNGSGKSTFFTLLKERLRPTQIGIYLNADELEKDILRTKKLDFGLYKIDSNGDEVIPFLVKHPLTKKADLYSDFKTVSFSENCIFFDDIEINSYHAAVCMDFIRQKLLIQKTSFTFETVMSSNDKIEFMNRARENGYRIYLYYISTEDPEININRVANRVRLCGHNVPKEKIVSRYTRSLSLLPDAIRLSDRAFLFDNSGQKRVWIAEITDGKSLEWKVDTVPNWCSFAIKKRAHNQV